MKKRRLAQMRSYRLSQIIFLALLFTVACTLLPVPCTLANAAVPHLINYQGRLTDKDSKPLEGNYIIIFRVYDAENAGSLLWEETQTAQIQKGVFNVLLGSVADLDLPFDKPYYLEIKVGDEVMSPRQRVTSTGYAYMAENVLSVPRGVIVMWSGNIADIPSGWALCDGSNSTPDLRSKFLVGAGSSYNIGNSGGATEHNHGAGSYTGPNHRHSVPYSGWSYYSAGANGVAKDTIMSSWDNVSHFNADNLSGYSGNGNISGTSASASSLPPYYAVAFIMKL